MTQASCDVHLYPAAANTVARPDKRYRRQLEIFTWVATEKSPSLPDLLHYPPPPRAQLSHPLEQTKSR